MKKTAKKILGVLFLVLALVTTQIPATGVFAKTENPDAFEMDGTTLVKYTGTAATVSVSNAVKVIGEEAFAGNEYVKEVKLPDSVEEISYRAFANCTALEKVTLSDNIISIKSGAFSNCAKLKEIYFGKNLKDIGYGIFAGCDELSKLTLSKENNYFMYKDGLLYDDEGKVLYFVLKGADLKSVVLPSKVEKIMPYAFYGCDSIENITLSEYMDSIEDYALSNVKNLKSIVIPYSVKRIGLKAFADCINLRDVTIHPTVKSIHETAFDGCVRLNIIAEEGSCAYEYFENLVVSPVVKEEYEDVEDIIYNINDNVVSLEDAINYNRNNNTSADDENLLGSTVVSSGHAVILIDNTKQKVNSGTSYTDDTQKDDEKNQSLEVIDLFGTTDVKGNAIPKYAIVGDEIASKAYYGNSMKEYTFAEGITSINDFAFARSSLTSVSIPDTVTHIGYGAFYHCDELENVYIPKSVTEIEPFAFDNTLWLSKWYKKGEKFLIVGDGILLSYNGNENHVTIPDGVKRIAPYVFYDNTTLKSVSLPDSLIEIGEAAFCGCEKLEDVYGGINLETISDRAFYQCPIGTIKITDKVKSIGLSAFSIPDDREAKEKTVIFYGDELPNLSYEKSATRLSNGDYRKMALENVVFAVLKNSSCNIKETVLDESAWGFRGLILSVVSEENATMEILDGYLTSDEIKNLNITDKVTVFQKTYTITNLDEYLEKNNIQNKRDNIDADTPWINVINRSKNLPDTEGYEAKSDAIDTAYTLTIDELTDENSISSFENLYQKLYGESIPANTCYLDLNMYETKSGVPVTKFGKTGVYLTIPLNRDLQEGTLHVICLDVDGQLEEVPYTVEENGGAKKIIIKAEHFSPYALYSYSGSKYVAQAVVKDGEAIFKLGDIKLDDSPDTGDYINPKWFLATGFAFLGLILILWKKKTK